MSSLRKQMYKLKRVDPDCWMLRGESQRLTKDKKKSREGLGIGGITEEEN